MNSAVLCTVNVLGNKSEFLNRDSFYQEVKSRARWKTSVANIRYIPEANHYHKETDSDHYRKETDSDHYRKETDSDHYRKETDSYHYRKETDSDHYRKETDSDHYRKGTDSMT